MSKTDEDRKLFGTDGIRGVANQHPMTAEIALALGRAVAERFGRGVRRCRPRHPAYERSERATRRCRDKRWVGMRDWWSA
jgi:hypothetical protein